MTDNTAPQADDRFPHVTEREREIVAKYGDLLNNTGGNDPLDLLNDFNKPSPNNLMRVNIVRFTLAMGFHAQVALLAQMEAAHRIASTEPAPTREEWASTIAAERDRQVEKGYTPQHDDEQGVRHLLNWAIDYGRRGKAVEAGALVWAAMDSLDRRGIDA